MTEPGGAHVSNITKVDSTDHLKVIIVGYQELVSKLNDIIEVQTKTIEVQEKTIELLKQTVGIV